LNFPPLKEIPIENSSQFTILADLEITQKEALKLPRPTIKPNSKAGVRPASRSFTLSQPIPLDKAPIEALIVPKKPPAPKTPNELLFYGFHEVRALFKTRRQDIIRAYCTERTFE